MAANIKNALMNQNIIRHALHSPRNGDHYNIAVANGVKKALCPHKNNSGGITRQNKSSSKLSQVD